MWNSSFKTSFEVSTWAVVTPFNYPLDIPIGTEKMNCSLRHSNLSWHEVEVFLSMGFLVTVFQRDSVMLHFWDVWLFWGFGIPPLPPNFKPESLSHPISDSGSVPGCSPAVSVPCVDFFPMLCSLCWWLQSWRAHVVLCIQLSVGSWRSPSLVHLEREKQQQPIAAVLAQVTTRTKKSYSQL